MLSKISADTNVLFSGLYYGGAAAPLLEAVRNCELDFYQSEYLKNEIVFVCRRSYRPLAPVAAFYFLPNVHVVIERPPTEEEYAWAQKLVRDLKDVPGFLFAKKMVDANAIDFFVTGDKDLLQPAVRKACRNRIITLQQFNKRLEKEARKR